MLNRGCGACKAPHRVVGKVMKMEYVSAGARKAGEVSQGTNLLESLPKMDRDITIPSKNMWLIIGHSKFRLHFDVSHRPAQASPRVWLPKKRVASYLKQT